MEADEVYSELNEKLSGIGDKLSEFQGTIDSLQSSISEQKSLLDKTRSDIDQINSALNSMKSDVSSAKQDNSQQTGLFDLQKKIEDANAAAEKRYADQQGLIYKLSAQAEDAAKMLVNFPDTAKAIANKAWEDGKKEILNGWEDSKKQLLGAWEDSKKDILNSVSSLTTPLIKDAINDARNSIKSEIKDELKSLILDDVKDVQTEAKSDQPAPLSDSDLEAKIRTIASQVAAEKQAATAS